MSLANNHRLAKVGDVYPIGDSVGTVNIGGVDWDLHDGFNGAMHVFSFVAPQPVNDFDGNIKDFFDHITQNSGFPADSQNLLSKSLSLWFVEVMKLTSAALQFGTEPFNGGPATFTVNNWSGSVE